MFQLLTPLSPGTFPQGGIAREGGSQNSILARGDPSPLAHAARSLHARTPPEWLGEDGG